MSDDLTDEILYQIDYAMAGKRIRFIRKKEGLKQLEMAAIMECSSGYISKVECGKEEPSLKFLAKFCERNNCSMDFIIFGIETKRIGDELDEIFETVRVDYHGASQKRIIASLRRILPVIIAGELENFPKKNKKDGIFKN